MLQSSKQECLGFNVPLLHAYDIRWSLKGLLPISVVLHFLHHWLII